MSGCEYCDRKEVITLTIGSFKNGEYSEIKFPLCLTHLRNFRIMLGGNPNEVREL